MELVILSAVGGLLALDATSVGQFMVSRPLVAGVLAGWVVGDPAAGLVVGSTLELYLLVSFPSGGARFPEGAVGTVVAVTAAAGAEGAGALPLAVASGLLWGQVGGFTITGLRHLNARLAPAPGGAPSPATVARVHLGGVALDLVRGTAVTGVGVLVGPPAVAFLAPAWPLALPASVGLLLVGGAASAGIFLRSVGGFRAHPALFLGGLLLGLVGGRLL